ncbi:Cysteine-rich repeat secretory protein 12 [Hibiscus syriacus]|uniref:Cysteine-rich repeat secretory protein 12 n=1 Tax=Hibiscus syriacus TaxID=106335 RepID=A0A6A3CSB0_HIBSY|nr:plasmodesmata-located protein 6-like [Hibiscus syriacus]KAE8730078.1 Cysteine-rich repeat secretory protein 12 [Hibiscus syriacus]
MALATRKASFLPFLLLLLFVTINPSNSATDTFVFGGCSRLKFISGSPYEYNVNSILTSLVNSATFTSYNNFTVPASGSASQDTVYGLFQCRGDLSNGDCGRCVAKAVSQLGTLCLDSTGGGLQLEGCFVKYDNTTFLGVKDKTVVVRRCGPLISTSSDALARRDAVLGYLGASDGTYKPFRIVGSGDVQGVAQCVGDLSPSECQDCLSEAIGRLKTDCAAAKWGDMYLAKCYARYSEGGDHSHGGNDTNNNDDEIEKTLAILIGLIAGVALLVVFVSFLSKLCEKDGKGGK